jgi:arylformamidase
MDRTEEWIDISVPIKTGMVQYPGEPAYRIQQERYLGQAMVSNLLIGTHTGTHVDAPLHFFETGLAIDHLSFDAVVGMARVIEIRDQESITVHELEEHGIEAGEILLFKTRNSSFIKSGLFRKDFVYLSTEGARYLAQKKVKTVGIDYLGVGGFERNETEAHRILLSVPIVIIETLDLSSVRAGVYDFVCVPLRIEGAEASPARAIVRPHRG